MNTTTAAREGTSSWQVSFWMIVRSLATMVALIQILAGATHLLWSQSMEWGTHQVVVGLAIAWIADRSRAWDERAKNAKHHSSG